MPRHTCTILNVGRRVLSLISGSIYIHSEKSPKPTLVRSVLPLEISVPPDTPPVTLHPCRINPIQVVTKVRTAILDQSLSAGAYTTLNLAECDHTRGYS